MTVESNDNKQALCRLTTSINSGKCIAVVGAGCSVAAYGTSYDLANDLLTLCGVPEDRWDPKKDLPSSAELAKTTNPTIYSAVLFSKFSTIPKLSDRPMAVHSMLRYHNLSALRFHSYISLNFDRLLEYALLQRESIRIAAYPGLSLDLSGSTRLLAYVHGAIPPIRSDDDVQILLTESELDEAYSGSFTSTVVPFWSRALFGTETVCFVGCRPDGPGVRQVLDFAKKTYDGPAGRKRTRPDWFWLSAREDQDPNELAFVSNIGIDVIQYDKRDDSHSGLDELLSNLARGANASQPVGIGNPTPYEQSEEPSR